MANLVELKAEPQYQLTVSEDEIKLIRCALIVMRNVKFNEERLPAVMRGQVSLKQSVDAMSLLATIKE